MKPSTDDNTQAAAVAAPAAAPAAARTVIRAVDGKWPEPPAAGRWSRDPKSGDLTLIEAVGVRETSEQRITRREKQRAAALQTNSKE